MHEDDLEAEISRLRNLIATTYNYWVATSSHDDYAAFGRWMRGLLSKMESCSTMGEEEEP